MSLIIDVKVVPKSSKQKCILDSQNKLKVYLRNPPESGKANAELVEFIQKSLGLRKSDIAIIFGETSRNKKLKINSEISFEKFLELMGIERQLKI